MDKAYYIIDGEGGYWCREQGEFKGVLFASGFSNYDNAERCLKEILNKEDYDKILFIIPGYTKK